MSAAVPPRVSGKIWLFRLCTAALIPLLLLLALEGGLRLVGYGRPATFLIPDAQPGFVRTNPDFVGLFLPESFDLRPLNYRVAIRKPANTVRVVVLGESAAQGIPVPAFAFAPQLRAQLRARYPGKAIEVLNTGVVAINSHVVYQVARDLARYEPDLFVVYLGNNEVVGPYGPGCSYLSDMWPVRLIRLSVWLHSTRTGQLVAAAANRPARAAAAPREWGGMAMFMDHGVAGDDPRLELVYRSFDRNLRDIVRVAEDAGAKALLCTTVSNLADSPPFLSLHRAGLAGADLSAWTAAFDAGRLAWRLGEADVARRHLREAWQLDPHYADTAFMLGSLAAGAGDPAEARRYFLEAQHWDALRFRPDPRLNEIVRAVARDHPAVTLVDAARELGSDPSSTGAPSGRELFFEHVHFDWVGNYRLGKLLADGAAAALFAGQPAARPALGPDECAAAVGYTPHERFSVLQRALLITQNPPFTNQLTYVQDQAATARALALAEQVARSPAAREQAREILAQAVARDPDNPDLAKLQQEVADDLGDTAGALAQVRRGRALQPYSFALATDEAIKLARLGRFDEAEQLLRTTAATCSERDLAKMAPAFADFFTRTKRFADGRAWFNEAIARHPAIRSLVLFRGRLAEFGGDRAAAEQDYRTVLAADPANQAALESLVAVLAPGGRAPDIEQLSLAAVKAQPGNQANHFRLAGLLEARGDQAGAARALIAAAQSGPIPTAIAVKIATSLYQPGGSAETLRWLAEARRLAQGDADPEMVASIEALIRRIRAEELPAR